MVVDWELTTLGAEAELICGFPFRSSEYTDNPCDVRLLRGDNIVQGNIRWANAKRWSLEDAANFEQYELKKDDVVLAMDRPWIDAGLKYAAIGDDDLPCLLLQRTSRLRGGQNLDIRFLRYVIGSPEFTKHIQSITTGSLVPHISSRQIKDFAFKLPPLATQKRIAAVLSALDAKIALNQRINHELEGMAKLLYDYWFVQYDFPLSAAQAAALGKPRLAGQPYRTSGGKMVFHPTLKREIPVGWEVKPIESILAKEGPSKKIPASEILKSGPIPVIDQSKDFICGFTHDEDALIHGSPKIIFGDHTRILKFINFDFARGADGTQIIASNSESLPPHLFYHSLLKIDLSSYGYARHFKFLKQSSITLPDSPNAQKFEEIVTAHYQLIRANTFQNQELTALRDWLLPMLMNGQVRVGCPESRGIPQNGGPSK